MTRIHHMSDWPAALREAATTAAAEARSVSSLRCPACDGGRTHEDSLSVWVDGRYAKAHCWRAACNYSADAPLDGDVLIGPPRFAPRNYEGELVAVKCKPWLADRYGLEPATIDTFGVQELVTRLALYMPVWGKETQARGAVVRTLDMLFDGPKAISYKATDMPWQAWYYGQRVGDLAPVVVVEDQLSAMRAYQLGYVGCALLGTNMNREKAAEIRQYAGERQVLLALDADATSKAIGYARQYTWLQVRRLTKDLKDSADAEILDALSGEGER